MQADGGAPTAAGLCDVAQMPQGSRADAATFS